MVKKIALLTGLLLMISLLVSVSPHSIVREVSAQDDPWWSGFGTPEPQGLSAPGSDVPSAAPMTSESVRTTTAWHLAERFYNTVVYYAFFAPIEVIMDIVGGITRAFIGI